MNTQNGQTPLDYLNEISPQAQKRPLFALNLRTVILGALILVVLIIIIASVSGIFASAKKEPWERLSARLAATATIVDGSTNVIKNSQLRSINSDVKLYLTNTQRDLTAPLAKAGIDPKKISPSVAASEASTDMSQRLEDGRLNAKYDSTYAREMKYQLATILSLLQQLYSSSSTSSQAILKTAYDNLLPTYTAVSNFSASNE